MSIESAFRTARGARARHVVGLLAVLLAAGLFTAGGAAADVQFADSLATSTLPSGADTGNTWSLAATACGTGDRCVAGGFYVTPGSAVEQAMLMAVTAGIPAPAVAVTLPGNADTSKSSYLQYVSCQGADSCTAVGTYTDSGGNALPMVVQITDGVPASAVEITASLATTATSNQLTIEDFSCPSSGVCAAVGYYYSAPTVYQGVVVPITSGVVGTAVALSLPGNAYSNPDAVLGKVACQGSGSCMALGEYQLATDQDAYVSVPISSGVPAAGVQDNVPTDYFSSPALVGATLNSQLACPASGSCEAVIGWLDSSSDPHYMAASVTAAGFSSESQFVVPPPDINGTAEFWAMSCSSASLCVASGNYEQAVGQFSAVTVPVTTAGAAAASVTAAAPSSGFYGVACLVAGPCLSAGFLDTGTSSAPLYEPLLEQVSASGTAASSVQAPMPADANTTSPLTYLESVSCSPLGSCISLGSELNTKGLQEPFVLSEQQPLLITNSDPLPSATVGSSYQDTFTATGGWGPGTYTWSATGLPAGITLNAQTGAISGTPTVAGTATVDFTVTGTGTPAPTATASFPLVVQPKVPRIKLEKASTAVRGSRVAASLLCGVATCSGVIKLERTVTVTVKKGKKRVREHRIVLLGSVSYSAAVDKTEALKIALNGRGRRALSSARHHRLAVTLVASVKGGAQSTRHETIRLVAKKRKTKK